MKLTNSNSNKLYFSQVFSPISRKNQELFTKTSSTNQHKKILPVIKITPISERTKTRNLGASTHKTPITPSKSAYKIINNSNNKLSSTTNKDPTNTPIKSSMQRSNSHKEILLKSRFSIPLLNRIIINDNKTIEYFQEINNRFKSIDLEGQLKELNKKKEAILQKIDLKRNDEQNVKEFLKFIDNNLNYNIKHSNNFDRLYENNLIACKTKLKSERDRVLTTLRCYEKDDKKFQQIKKTYTSLLGKDSLAKRIKRLSNKAHTEKIVKKGLFDDENKEIAQKIYDFLKANRQQINILKLKSLNECKYQDIFEMKSNQTNEWTLLFSFPSKNEKFYQKKNIFNRLNSEGKETKVEKIDDEADNIQKDNFDIKRTLVDLRLESIKNKKKTKPKMNSNNNSSEFSDKDDYRLNKYIPYVNLNDENNSNQLV